VGGICSCCHYYFFNKLLYLGPKTWYHLAAATNPLCLVIRSGAAQEMVRFCYELMFTQIWTHFFYNWNAVIWQCRDMEFLNTQTGYCLATAATPLHLYIQSNTIKKWRETSVFWHLYSYFTQLFQIICHFLGNARSMIKQSSDKCLPHCHCCPLAFNKTKQRGKKNG
jgi:hypothetical protein